MVFGVALIVIHSFGSKLGLENLLSYTSLNNVGLSGVNSFLSFAILAKLAWVMTRHGNDRRIRTLVSPNVPNTARVCNRLWLKINGLGRDVTIDSLYEYLKKKFNDQDQLNTVRDIKRQLLISPSGLKLIQRRFWDKNNNEEDATAYYTRKENILLAEKDAMIKNSEFIGTAFIRFDDPAQAKATKMAIINHQKKWFRYSIMPQKEDEFRLRHWTVRYAPPGSHINWQQLEGQHSIWKKLSALLMLLIAYSTYITVMATPGFVVRSLYLPLPLLFSGQLFDSQHFRLECLFFPEHGSFIACSIIVNTASRILMDQTRFQFLFNYLKKVFTFRSQGEHTAWRKSYRLEFDFASRYAELTSNFVLTCLIIINFPVIGIVSWISSILTFLSDRSALMNIYAVSSTNPNIHQEPVNIVLSLSILSPLALLIYRIVQLGPNLPNHLLDDRFIAPLCVTIVCALHLIYAFLRYFPKRTWLRRWVGYVEDDEEDMIDLMSNAKHEYDPIKALNFEIHQSV
ncbi:hypothetical protein DAPPUDRAFT_96630 [Daphnia pulex]|uniref:CSC1/OSCA1-like cytosolic domain-containing protein n=1 Tax=Daphnia pulex TaxID=6669 RepID=E9FYF6_DAPPU|nr:hypothetical protein DAPPUDRAFT_96630 [Daphnia pulex]|eukprot:EFX87523.1 hypothetical protein DAPPUDRAFT_96630 [Daphnia pulex]